jgi:hypothetical protein
MDPAAYMEQRVDDQLDYLRKSSRRSKTTFMGISLFEIVLGTAITICTPFIGKSLQGRLLISVAGGAIALSSGVLALTRSQENWVRYRSLAEQLKSEKYIYATGTPPYDGPPEKSFHEFVNTVEALMLEERGSWARSYRGETSLSAQEGEGEAER